MIKGVKSSDSETSDLGGLEVYIYPSEMTDTSKVKFTYRVTNFD